MNLKKQVITNCLSVAFVAILFLLFLWFGSYVATAKINQQPLINLDQQIASLQDKNQALQNEIDAITGRTLQLWLVNKNGELTPIGPTRLFAELIPKDLSLFTKDLGDGVGYTDSRTDIYVRLQK